MLSSILRGLAAAMMMFLTLHGASSALADEPADEAPATPSRAASPGRCSNASVSGVRLRPEQAAKAVRCLINKHRDNHGLNSLRANQALREAAKRHTDKMVESGCFEHQCSSEPDVVGRVTSAGYLPCNCSWKVGENIGWGEKGESTPAAIVKAWMKSPEHRAIILTDGFQHVDVGVEAGKPGQVHVRAATYTADFGARG